MGAAVLFYCEDQRVHVKKFGRSDYQKLVKAARGRGDERLCAIYRRSRARVYESASFHITAESLAQGK